MSKVLILVMFLISCGDDKAPFKWGDAVDVWSTDWCDYQYKCFKDPPNMAFSNYKECIVYVKDANCINTNLDCTSVYTELECELNACSDDMKALSCDSNSTPLSCLAAFGY